MDEWIDRQIDKHPGEVNELKLGPALSPGSLDQHLVLIADV